MHFSHFTKFYVQGINKSFSKITLGHVGLPRGLMKRYRPQGDYVTANLYGSNAFIIFTVVSLVFVESMQLFLSFFRRGKLSRGSCEVRVHRREARFLKSHEQVRVRTRVLNAKGGRVRRIRCIVSRTRDLGLIIDAVKHAFGDTVPKNQLFPIDNGCLLAAQLTWENGQRQQWISPEATRFLEIYQDLKQTRRQLQTLRNNGGKGSEIRFFERAERIAQGNLLFDCGLSDVDESTGELLASEIENFRQGFSAEF